LPLSEEARYLLWRLGGKRWEVALRMKSGKRLLFRPETRFDRDYGTSYDVFTRRLYDVDLLDARWIVDLGANVGFASLFFCERFPNARIDAFEPHPGHCERARRLFAINGVEERVTLHQEAVSNRAGEMRLTDESTASRLTNNASEPGINVRTVDFFEWAKQRGTIDILKIDIEFGEYPLLADPRFAELDCRHIVMEWHEDDVRPDGGTSSVDTLRRPGYVVSYCEREEATITTGMIHAEKAARAERCA
jgi:FkbM family methyltransferase